jgi:hypothetical protein
MSPKLHLGRKIKTKSTIYYLRCIYVSVLICVLNFEKALRQETICEV